MTKLNEYIRYLSEGEQDRRHNRYMQGVSPKPVNAASIGIPPVDSPTVWGMDIAGVYDGVPDYAAFKARGGKFVYIKAADGTIKAKWIDENIKAAKAQELVVGAYFWLYRNARISGNAQATAWWNIVKDYKLDFHVVDFEWTMWGGVADNPTTNDLWGVITPFQSLSFKMMWIYTASGYWNQYSNGSPLFVNNPLIIANYGVTSPASILPWKAGGHTMWQCSETWPGAELGVDPYASKAEDGDIFNGDIVKFNQMFGTVIVPPEPPPSVGHSVESATVVLSDGSTTRLIPKG